MITISEAFVLFQKSSVIYLSDAGTVAYAYTRRQRFCVSDLILFWSSSYTMAGNDDDNDDYAHKEQQALGG